MLRLAAVGFRHGHNWSLVKGLLATGAFEMVAVAEDHPELAARAAREYGVPVYESAGALLERHEVDLASLAPTNNRKADCIAALAARGVHCLVDKPLTTTLGGLARIEAAVRAAGVVCVMALPVRFFPAHWTARRLVAAGAIGRIASAWAVRSHNLHPGTRRPWELTLEENGGPLVDLGSHDYDYIAWCLQGRPISVFGSHVLARYTDLAGFVDAAQMCVRFDDGSTAYVSTDWLTPDGAKGSATSVQFIGTGGALRVLEHEEELWLLTADRDWEQVPADEGVPNLYVDLQAAMRGEPHVVKTEECLAAARVLLAGRQSAETGTVVACSWRTPANEGRAL